MKINSLKRYWAGPKGSDGPRHSAAQAWLPLRLSDWRAGPPCHWHRTGETAHVGAAMVELADGDLPDETDGTGVPYVMNRVYWYSNLAPYWPLSTPATELGGSAMAHGGARPRSGRTEPARTVTPSPEQQRATEKTKQEVGKEERSCAVLATVSSNSGELRWRRELNWATTLGYLARRWDGVARGGEDGAER